MKVFMLFVNRFVVMLMISIMLVFSNVGYSQMLKKGQKPDKLFAKYCLKFHNYYDGLKEFQALLNLHPKDDYYRWGIGYCHLHLNKDKAAAIPYFKKVLKNEKADQAIWYDLGEAYLYVNQLDNAEDAFKKYINAEIVDEHEISAKRMLEMIENARKSIASPIDVSITNIGKKINTKFPEFAPYINGSEKYLVFSKQSQKNAGRYRHEDGYFPADVYHANMRFGHWRRVKRFSSMINSSAIEINGFLSSNAAFLYIQTETLLSKEKGHFLYNKRGRHFGYPKEVKIDGVDMFYVKSLMISKDRKWIIFSAPTNAPDRKDLDLYYAHKNPEGFWQNPTPFDSTVNTIYNESFPYFAPNGLKFFFASQGHNSMGGYDIFKSEISIDTIIHITNVANLGYPVNTTMDDKTISFTRSCRYAYISSLRKGGFGDLDIYRVVFEEQQPLYSVIHGKVFDSDSIPMLEVLKAENDHIDTLNFPINHEYKRILLKEKDSVAAMEYLAANKIPYHKLAIEVKAVDKKTNEIVGRFIVKEKDASYTVILPPGEYQLYFSRNNFGKKMLGDIKIEDYDLRNRYFEQHVLLGRE